MAKIALHTPMHLNDYATTIEYDADFIIHYQSITGDDSQQGTNFYLKGIPEKQFCLESVNELKKMLQNNLTPESTSASTLIVGTIIHGDQAISKGVAGTLIDKSSGEQESGILSKLWAWFVGLFLGKK